MGNKLTYKVMKIGLIEKKTQKTPGKCDNTSEVRPISTIGVNLVYTLYIRPQNVHI